MPIVFETMVFYNDDESDILGRYSTWNQAYNGHILSLNALKNGTGVEDIKTYIDRNLKKENDDENEKINFDIERSNVIDIRSLT